MKQNFIKKTLLLASLSMLLLASAAFVLKSKATNSNSNRVMLYGIVYQERCNSEAYQLYEYVLADEENYNQKQRELKVYLENKYPDAKRIRVSSSIFDYGSSAKGMCIIKWQIVGKNCSYENATAYFGKSESHAQERAITEKNRWGGVNARYSILETKGW